MNACKDCEFWALPNSGSREFREEGQCRRHSPVALDERYKQAMWPRTMREDGCGDFQQFLKTEEEM